MNGDAEMLRFDVVDVFAARAFAGNPLAVVHGARELDTAQLQAIAREFNLSETVFPLPPTLPEASYRVRIFTPGRELPFAGHPSVGVAWVLARDGLIRAGEGVQECAAGLLPVWVDAAGARISGGSPRVGPDIEAAGLARAVGLDDADVDRTLRAGVVGAGLDFPMLAVHGGAVARAVAPALSALPRVAQATGHVLVFAFDKAARRAHVRMFGVGYGVSEDPATGSAAVALGVFLVDRGVLSGEGTSEFTVSQGAEIGRPSRLDVEVSARCGTAERTSVGGRVIPMSRGEIRVPARAGSAEPS